MARFWVEERRLERFYDARSPDGALLPDEDIPESIIGLGCVSDDDVATFRSFFESVAAGRSSATVHVKLRVREGSYRPYRADYALVCDEGGASHAVMAFRALDRASCLAVRDSLTSALSRSAFEESVRENLARLGEGGLAALFMVDLDDFKQINDTFGHQRGDDVLRFVADALARVFPPPGFVGRVGGDEFMALAPGGVGEEEAAALAQEALDALEFPVEGRTGEGLIATASIGVATTVGPATFEELYALADEELYRAKHAGKRRFRIAGLGQAR